MLFSEHIELFGFQLINPIFVSRIYYSIIAIILVIAPLPPLIFIGRAIASNPLEGSLSRFATFSKIGVFASQSTTCALNILKYTKVVSADFGNQQKPI